MIADLGLSRIGRANENDSYLITLVGGTHGYGDPAYVDTGFLTKESDVYSFGVVMFEVLCGRLSIINADKEHQLLAPLAQHYFETGRLNEIIDPYLKMEVDTDSLEKFSEIAYPCLHDERDQRPSMSLVVQQLEELMASIKVTDESEDEIDRLNDMFKSIDTNDNGAITFDDLNDSHAQARARKQAHRAMVHTKSRAHTTRNDFLRRHDEMNKMMATMMSHHMQAHAAFHFKGSSSRGMLPEDDDEDYEEEVDDDSD
uniref:putative receptor-like protein kinase At5g39000 n=1 Tax=Erigeron canadensis TaxID=72917 RepID=UPI001CB8E790|nr:putative receptor-like protein kinase At5g39000 [Erigeron canadensis]